MTSIKTGQTPDFKSQTDLSRAIPAIGKQVGITDIGEAIAFYKKHKTAIQAVLSFLGGIFGHKSSSPAPAGDPGPAPGGSTGTPPDPGSPATPTPVPPQGTRRIPTSLHSEMTLVETKRRPREAGGGRDSHGETIGDHETFKEIKAGTTPTRRGARVHIDTTPSDRFGKFKPGGDENLSLRIRHVLTGDAELTSEYDDFGCTPVILIPWEQAPGVPYPIDTGKRWEVTYQAIQQNPDGTETEGNVVRWIVEE